VGKGAKRRAHAVEPMTRSDGSDVGTRSLSSGRPKAGPVGFAHPTFSSTASLFLATAVDS
jgi:hypothetical protein